MSEIKTNKYIQIALPSTDLSDWESMKESIESGWLTQGPKVKEFENKFSDFIGVKHSTAVSSCTTALHLALKAIGVGKNDIVIVSAFTWVASANAIEYCGAKTVFCDIVKQTFSIDPQKLEELVKNLVNKGQVPKAIIPVHLFGLCADMNKIQEIARKYDIKIVEDAACAIGAKYKNNFAGTLSDIGCFSFHPRKIITTGEGGMCVTNNTNYYEKINCMKSHGASISEEQRHFGAKPYLLPDFDVLGYNYRMTDLQGSIGISQMNKLKTLLCQRRERAKYYDKELASIDWIETPVVPEECTHSYQSYVCMVRENRNEIMDLLHQKGIATRPGTHAVHKLGYYAQKYNIKEQDFPAANEADSKSMAIPLHNKMTNDDYEYIVKTLKEL